MDTNAKSNYLSLLGRYWPLYGLIFLIGTENFIVSPFIPAMARETGNPVRGLAAMVTTYAVTYAVMAPMFGSASDRFGRRIMVILGSLVFLAGNLSVALASALPSLLLARGAMGFGAAMAGPAIWAHIADTTASHVRGRAMGLGMGAFSLGQIIGIPVGGAIASLASWRAAFGGIGLAMLPLLLVIVVHFQGPAQRHPTPPPKLATLLPFAIWGNGSVRMIFLVTFFFHAANLGSYTFLGTLLLRNYHFSTAQLGSIGVLVGTGSLLGSLFGGMLGDHWQMRGWNASLLVTLWALLLAAAVFTATRPVPVVLAMGAIGVWFVASGAFVTTQQARVTLAAPSMRATAVSWNNSIMFLGTGIGVWLMGFGTQHDLSVASIGFAFAMAAALLTSIHALRVPLTREEPA